MEHLMEISVLAEVYPDGQRVTAAILEYDKAISSRELQTKSYHVENARISRIYANTEPKKCEEGRDGKFVIAELSFKEEEAFTVVKPKPVRKLQKDGGDINGEKHQGISPAVRRKPSVDIQQTEAIVAADGTTIEPPGNRVPCTRAIQPMVDLFIQKEYRGIPYNLYIPKDYDAANAYPLLMFIPDAGANGSDPLLFLTQGIGGIIWASEQEQAKHPSFVVAVQIPYEIRLTNNDHKAAEQIEYLKELLDAIVQTYHIDNKRIYITGQSQGCMASCELNIRYPEYFAASLLVAGHWDVEKMAALAHKNFFLALSEGGMKEFPNMNEMCAAFAQNGGKVAERWVNAQKTQEQIEEEVRELTGTDANILYLVFDKEHALPDDGREHQEIEHHNRGWELTYGIEAVRDWIFSKSL